MELYNLVKREQEELRKSEGGKLALKESLEAMLSLLSPFTPHICEELWERTGHKTFLISSPWLSFDPDLAREEKVTIVVEVNGKLRDRFETERGLAEAEVKDIALNLERIKSFLGDKKPKNIIYIENKLVNIVL
jgi:leucyl-tRNA synthetase